ncbi:hypothetical protein [Planococcus lenghuensis]|uniref:Uncharacterized protein n=1 Tax=Planococcus lenghuensis TaxID=2213202 RepID=A0A1Q2KYJ1_9BACL|nr:hypothetical protein [Planococcus lenghuensis]AQQ53259.1 hypothetical protein B0X71_09320 [Planococcus lenghuensis]
MKSSSEKQVRDLQEHQWVIRYDGNSETIKLINEQGEEMDLKTMTFLLDELQNEIYDQNTSKYGRPRTEPLDELARKRRGIQDYRLITDRVGIDSREIFEVYSDPNGIFTLNSYRMYKGRKRYDDGFLAYLTELEVQEVLGPLKEFADRHRKR